MAAWTLATLAALASFSQVRGTVGGKLLPRPHNVTLVSKDFSLFLTWLPGAGYPPGVFYSVQWANVFNTWEDFLPCRNISETVCNITCTSPDLHHSYDVRVKAQTSAGTISSEWVYREGIDYAVDVKLAPPVLQVRKIGDTVVVNVTFSDPLCLKDLYSDLTTDLEFWEVGTNNRKKTNMKSTKDFDATIFNGSDYCFSARANLDNERSNFSEPTCVRLHNEADTWAFAAIPVLLLFILVAFIGVSLNHSKSRPVKSPQALDFSSLKCPKKFQEFTRKEFISVLTCPGHPVVVENRSRLIPQIHSQLVPAVLEEYEDEEEDEEDDTSSLRPYTEMHRFQKNDMHSQVVGLGEQGPDPCSESDSSQLGEGSMPDLTRPGFFVFTNSVYRETTSGLQGSETTSLSAGSSSEESSVCPDSYLASQREGQEDSDEHADFLIQLSDSNLPTRKPFVPSESFCEASCGTLGYPQISLFGVQNNQDFCGLLLGDEKLSENDSCSCGRCVVEVSPLKVSSREGLASSLLGGNGGSIADSSPEPKYHGYQPRPVHYLSRILPI